MSVLNLKELLKFKASDLKLYSEDIKKTHVQQARRGIDASGKRFPPYTARYARLKSSGKAAPNQSSRRTVVPDLTLTGSMWSQFKVISSTVNLELAINYGISGGKEAIKMEAHAKGRFGRPSKKSKITIKPEKKRAVASPQKVGPDVEREIALMFAKNIKKNLIRLTNRPTVIIV